MNFQKKNEVIKKHTRKYRARYWACNQIEEVNPDVCEVDDNAEEEDEQIDIDQVEKMGKTGSGFADSLAKSNDKKDQALEGQ